MGKSHDFKGTVLKHSFLMLAILIGLPHTNAHAKFGNNGIVTTDIGGYDYALSLILQPDGKLVAAGKSHNGSNFDFALVRYNSNGSLDTSFGSGGKVVKTLGSNDYANSLIQQPDGKLVAAGASGTGSNYDFALARFNSNGSLDTSFGSGGKVITAIADNHDSAYCLILQPNEKLVAAGNSDNGNNNDFALVRYNNDGSLDTQDNLPLLTEINPDHGLAGQAIDMDIHGWNLDDVIGVQLRNTGGSVNSSSFTIAGGAQINALFTLPASPGLYDLYLTKNLTHRTFTSRFQVLIPLAGQEQWQVLDLGKAGNPITGPAGIVIGAPQNSGQNDLYVANSDDRLFAYHHTQLSGWVITPLPQASGYVQDLLLADADTDGKFELYGASTAPMIYQYQWNNTDWNQTTICAYSGPMAEGAMAGGGLAELYMLNGNSLMQARLFNQHWLHSTIIQGSGQMLCSAVGDANNDGVNEIYAANADHNLYQYQYLGSALGVTTTVDTASDNMTCLAIGDLNHDGANELYGANLDGHIYEFNWNGSSWTSSMVNSTSLVANKIAISDGDDDGQDELYAAGQDGHVYQFKWNVSGWQPLDLGNAGSPLLALAVGDGDNSGQAKVYAVAANGHVYQFQAVVLPTPTPTLTPILTSTPTCTPTPVLTCTPTPTTTAAGPDFSGHLIDRKFFYVYPNPVRGDVVRFRFYLKQDAAVKVTVYTLIGEKVWSMEQHSSQGWHEVTWNTSGMANGGYMYRVEAAGNGFNETLLKKLALVR